MERGEIQKGMFLVSDGGPRLERSPVQHDIAAEFDAAIGRVDKILDSLAELKAKAKATKEWQDLIWRVGVR